ncbi:MAG: glycosyltransferase family 2 protein [Bacteroidia bacterium]|nr:glycosyltransferase family 2 protein [Bacteroidia bacterium]MDW8134113.1 glycosyltransferase family 2 protein [Bacteroidia bacterium]
MKVIGFMILRNGIKMDYPFREAILSALPLCDKFFVSVGQSEDETKESLLAMGEPKLVVIDSQWNLHLREGGKVLAQETNKLLGQLPPADWYLYLQADEVLHEADYASLQSAMEKWKNENDVEGLVFDYLHFYGSYEWVGASKKWYRREVRVIRPLREIQAYRDAQGFRRAGRKLRVKPAQARIFHYGWVRPPEKQRQKLLELHRYWHEDAWIEKNVSKDYNYDLNVLLTPFVGSHPAIMEERIRKYSWDFPYNPNSVKIPLRERILNWIEKNIGMRIGEFRNYRLI